MHPMRKFSGISFFAVIIIMDITARPLTLNFDNEKENGYMNTSLKLDSDAIVNPKKVYDDTNDVNLANQLTQPMSLMLSSDRDLSEEKNVKLSVSGMNIEPTVSHGNEHLSANSDKSINTAVTSNLRTIGNVSKTPEYMLQLYNQLSKRAPLIHNSNIIRSFKNIPQTNTNTTNVLERDGYRIHSLVFDISTISRTERTNSAELRLFTLITRDQRSFMGVSRLVSIYEVILISNEGQNDIKKYNYITSKYIHSVGNAWESFDVTSALKRSIRYFSKKEHLEVRIQSLFTDPSKSNMDINANPNDKKEPLLIVYSNDISSHHKHKSERHELIMHELMTSAASSSKFTTQLSTERPSAMYSPSASYNDVLTRPKRSRGHHRNSICRRRPLYVNFEDITWDSWIIAPRGYQAYQCAGKCMFPLREHMTPSNHAVVQTALHTFYPKRTGRACCVPTKLNPISILYIDELGVVTFKFRYDDMVVAECGCR